MDSQDGSDHSDAGHARWLGQGGYLAAHVHAHLKNGGLVFRAHPHHCERQPDLVVGVAFALEGAESRGQDRGHGLFGGGLGDAAGDAHDQRGEAATPRRGDGVEAEQGIRYGHDAEVPAELRGSAKLGALPDEQTGRSGGDRGAKESMAVRVLARQCHEEIARLDLPGIDLGPPGPP